MSSEIWGVVLAAGSGTRFGERKQFLEVDGRRLVDLSVQATSQVSRGVVVVLPSGCGWDGPPVHAVAEGGDTRIASARSGLAQIPGSAGIVLIHDAAHPLASARLFKRVLEAISRQGVDAAIPVLPTVDTVMRVDDGSVVETIPREGLVTVQTPQAFTAGALRAAYDTGMEASDESVLMQRVGASIRTVPGEIGNLHVTAKDDLVAIARLLPAR